MSLSPDQQQQTDQTLAAIQQAMAGHDGRIGFDRFMEMALYAPALGYYVNGTHKFGESGDFVTAPEISSLFSQALAQQCAQALRLLDKPQVLEFGAGSGRMAADILLHLEQLGSLPEVYAILELSPMLQAQQRQTLSQTAPHLLSRVVWLQGLPAPDWQGVVLGNEVLDAMPVRRFQIVDGQVCEGVVTSTDASLNLQWQPAQPPLVEAVRALERYHGPFAEGYSSELNMNLGPWLQSVSDFLTRGLLLLIDYGYSGAEYYHPQRHMGTLIAHYRHQAHDNVLAMPGLQDITANVDFSALAHAGLDAGLSLAGYTTQAFFLLGNGLDQLLQALPPEQLPAATTQLKQLTLPTAMGERFKVMGFQRGLGEVTWDGFAMRDMREYL